MTRVVTLKDLQREMRGELNPTLTGVDSEFSVISIDSRNVQAGDLFVALRGGKFDAHDFIADVIRKGAAGVVVEYAQPSIGIPQLQVSDTTLALGDIGRINREKYMNPMIAITGSSGKTTVRTMVDGILRLAGKVLSTNGNFNNHIGLPLTLLRLDGSEDYAVVEMGASAIGEIAYLCELAEPDVVLVNNVMAAHLEGFGSLEGVAQAKGEIYQGVKRAGCSIVNLDDEFSKHWLREIKSDHVITFSIENEKANCYADKILVNDNSTSFVLRVNGVEHAVSLMVCGRHNISNALAAASCAYAVGVSIEKIVQGLEAFSAVIGRMKLYSEVHQNILLIDDTYNANPGSVRAAIDVLSDMDIPGILVLGDMAELGEDAYLLHAELGAYASTKKIEAVFTMGRLARAVGENFLGVSRHFESKDTLIDYLINKVARNKCAVLIKGSRSANMDVVVKALTNKVEN